MPGPHSNDTATRASRDALCLLGVAYVVFVLYGSLLPFDGQWRSVDEVWSAYLGLGSDDRIRVSLTDFATNLILFAPLAFCWAGYLRLGGVGRGAAVLVVIACGTFSAGIEFLQVFFPPRRSSIYDLAANILGATAGTIAWAWLGRHAGTAAAAVAQEYALPDDLHYRLRRVAILAAAPYALFLTAANGWFAEPWLAPGDAIGRLGVIHLLPFLEHQTSGIELALASSLWQCALYVPLGFTLRLITRAPLLTRRVLLATGACGAAVAALMESGKLFVATKHPDVGDLVIAALGAMIGFVLWPFIVRLVRGDRSTPENRVAPLLTGVSLAPLLPRAAALLLTACVIGTLVRFPVALSLLAVGLAAYAVALTRWPWLWLWVVPATLPVLDLAPLSGWFYLDEFDLVVLTTLAVSLWHGRWQVRPVLQWDTRSWLVIAFATSILLSTMLGLWPLQPIDWNAFSSYHSHYNALRVAKGFLWALALTPLLLCDARDAVDITRQFTVGVIAGLAGMLTLAIWERYTYPGLFDFSREFRVGSFFSSMHVGGSHIEAYLVMAAPFLMVAAQSTRSWLVRLAMAVLFIGSTYVLMVTFSRGGYLAYALSLAVVIAIFARTALLRASWGVLAALFGTTAVALLVALPIALGAFAQQRIGASLHDLGVRVSHWEDALDAVNPGLATHVFGMGLGRYPETYFYQNREGKRPATFRYENESGNEYLKLGSGDRLYVEQIVSVAPKQVYRLSLDVRSSGDPAAVNLLFCERTYFYSYGCESATIEDISTRGKWMHHETTLNSGKLGAGTWLARRPVKLSLENPNAGTWVDVDNLALVDENGANLVANGDFTHGNAHWFFSTRDPWPWHIENLWVGLLFEQGWFGALAFSAIVLTALVHLARGAWRGESFGGAVLASIVGFLCVGLFGSLFEAPRLTTMFFLTLAASGALITLSRKPDAKPIAASSRSRYRADVCEPSVATLSSSVLDSHGGIRAEAEPAPAWKGFFPPRSALNHSAVGILVIALLVALVTRSPWVPYNLRDLPNPAHPYAAPVILAIAFYWVSAAPVWMARWFAQTRIAVLIFPLAVVIHGVMAWMIVRYAAYPSMIHKVTGSPVLRWPWDWETLARFAVLDGTLFLLLTGACIVVSTGIRRTGVSRLLLWLTWAILLLPIAHYVIVEQAATDNLTELMASGGTAWTSLLLAAWATVIGVSASMLATCIATRWQRAASQLTLIVLSIPLGFALLNSGTEAALEKYGAVFSALQFVLSPDRAHYATGWELGLRYIAFHVGLLCAVALAQYPLWAVPHNRSLSGLGWLNRQTDAPRRI